MALSRITNYIEADGADLNLQSSDTTITDGSVLGVINFKAPSEASGTDSILLASKIEAVAEEHSLHQVMQLNLFSLLHLVQLQELLVVVRWLCHLLVILL